MNKIGIACWVGAFVVLSGCAGTLPPQGNQSENATAQQPMFAIQFQGQEVKQQLVAMGLIQSFNDYWNSHAARDWARRYRMEEFQRPVEESFYAAYHSAAWQLLELHIDSVDVADAPERVRVSLRARFRNPDRFEEERSAVLQDLWTKRQQEWLHVNSDPMLNGLRSVK